jgi:predicted flap endonuclease-1-like 5' DNA nuclease
MFIFSSRKHRRTRFDPEDFTEVALLMGLLLALLIIGLARLRPRLTSTQGAARSAPPTGEKPSGNPTSPEPTPAAKSPRPAGMPGPEHLFHAELAEGLVRHDPALGYIYPHPPGQPDDLTRIKGVGQVLAGRLNEWGVYQFAQIAFWTPENIQEIGTRLSFSERIERDDWVGQARELWEQDRENEG